MKKEEERLQSIPKPSTPHLEIAIAQPTICSTALPFRASTTPQPMTRSTMQGKPIPRPAQELCRRLFQPTITQPSNTQPSRAVSPWYQNLAFSETAGHHGEAVHGSTATHGTARRGQPPRQVASSKSSCRRMSASSWRGRSSLGLAAEPLELTKAAFKNAGALASEVFENSKGCGILRTDDWTSSKSPSRD